MSHYICRNAQCERYGVPENVEREVFKYTADGLIGEKCRCPVCGKVREYINPSSEVPLSEKSVGVGTFSSKSAEQKRELLKKRSHDHFNKHVKERKDYLMNKAMGEMRNLGKN